MVMEKDNKQKNKKNDKNKFFDKRSPLQDLNGLKIHKTSSKILSAAVSTEPSSKNPCATSSSSSSSRTHFDKKLKTFPKLTYNGAPKVLLRSKEIEIPRKSSSKVAQRSKLSSVEVNPTCKLKKGFQGFGKKMKNSQANDLGKISKNSTSHFIEKCTPKAKIACGSGSDLSNFDENKDVRDDDSMSKMSNCSSATPAKTPPVEASISPEIQGGTQSKKMVLNSGATPVCYGAGHLLSGVADKRKCRRRGSLKGVCDNANLFYDEMNVVSDSYRSSIPLLAEASVHWHLSPCNEEHEDKESDSVNKLAKSNDNVILDLSSSPSSFCGNYSTLSFSSLSSGNLIQTPNSDSSSDQRTTLNEVALSPRIEKSMWDAPDFENTASHSNSVDLTSLQKNVNSVSSSVFDSTLETLALSQMRISWRDGLVSTIDETDEFDCCRCLSDEEINGEECSGARLVSCMDAKSGANDMYPNILDYEPVVYGKNKEKLSRCVSNTCVESISTNGGSLVASGDSDWTNCFSNHLSQNRK